jgi:uncharacterized membrane protein
MPRMISNAGAQNLLSALEMRLRTVFVAGLSLSAALLVCGLIMYFAAPSTPATSWLLNAGLVILMATPLLRVIVSMFEYAKIDDWVFVATTLVVLVELSVTMVYALI